MKCGNKGIRGSRSFGAKNNDPLEAIVFAGLLERLSWLWWGIRAKPLRWGRKPCSWAKYHGKRRENQGFSPIICVDEALRFPPQLDHSPTVRCFLYAYPYSDTSRTYTPSTRIYGYLQGCFPSSLATAKPRFYVGKFGQRAKVTL
jgi:hypothetical protein